MFACLCESVERMPNVHGQPICFNPIGWRSHPWQTCMLVGALSIVSLCSVKIKDVSTNKGKKTKEGMMTFANDLHASVSLWYPSRSKSDDLLPCYRFTIRQSWSSKRDEGECPFLYVCVCEQIGPHTTIG